MSLIIFLLVTFGTTNIVTSSLLFFPIRDLAERIHSKLGYWSRCPMCFGFASGMTWSILGLWSINMPFVVPAVVQLLFSFITAGFASSGFCWFMHVMLVKMGASEL
jgi:hypothetical protein